MIEVLEPIPSEPEERPKQDASGLNWRIAAPILLALALLWASWPYLNLLPGHDDLSLMLWTTEHAGDPSSAWAAPIEDAPCNYSPLVRLVALILLTASNTWVYVVAYAKFLGLGTALLAYFLWARGLSDRASATAAALLFVNAVVPLAPMESAQWLGVLLCSSGVLLLFTALCNWSLQKRPHVPVWGLLALLLVPCATSGFLGAVGAIGLFFYLFTLKTPGPRTRDILCWVVLAVGLATASVTVAGGWNGWLGRLPTPPILLHPSQIALHLSNVFTAGLGFPILAALTCAVVLVRREPEAIWWISVPVVWLLGSWFHALNTTATLAIEVLASFSLLAFMAWMFQTLRMRLALYATGMLAFPVWWTGGPLYPLLPATWGACLILGSVLIPAAMEGSAVRAGRAAFRGERSEEPWCFIWLNVTAIVISMAWLAGFLSNTATDRQRIATELRPPRTELYATAQRAVADCLSATDEKIVARLLGGSTNIDRLVTSALQQSHGWALWAIDAGTPPPSWARLETISGDTYFIGPPSRPMPLAIKPWAHPFDPRLASRLLSDMNERFEFSLWSSELVSHWKQWQEARRQVESGEEPDPFANLVPNSEAYQTIPIEPVASIEGWGPEGVTFGPRSDGTIHRNAIGTLLRTGDPETELYRNAPFPTPPPRVAEPRDLLTFWWYASDWSKVTVLRVALRVQGDRYRLWTYDHATLAEQMKVPADGWRFMILPVADSHDLSREGGEHPWLWKIGTFGVAAAREDWDPTLKLEMAIDDISLRLATE